MTIEMAPDALLPYANLSDEELLRHVYVTKGLRNALEIELAKRLESALDGTPEYDPHAVSKFLDGLDGENS
jgi:hypothetical protein